MSSNNQSHLNHPLDTSNQGITLVSDSSSSSNSSSNDQQNHPNCDQSQLHSENEEKYGKRQKSEKYHQNQNQAAKAQTQSEDLIFEPTSSLNLNKSQQNPNSLDPQPQNGKQLHQVSYNDTLSYLEDVLGSTFLNNLSKNSFLKQQNQLPPKIQSSSTCAINLPSEDPKAKKLIQSTKLKPGQSVLKPIKEQKIPESKLNPFVKKIVEGKQVQRHSEPQAKQKKEKKKKRSKDSLKQDKNRGISTNKSVSKIKRKEEVPDRPPAGVADKSQTRVVDRSQGRAVERSPARTDKSQHRLQKSQTRTDKSVSKICDPKRKKKYESQESQGYSTQQRQYYQNSQGQYGEYQQYGQYPYQHYNNHQNYYSHQQKYNQMPYYDNYHGYQNYPNNYHNRYENQYNGPGQYYVPGQGGMRRKRLQDLNEDEKYMINGWHYPIRGNVIYDKKQQNWVLTDQMTLEDKYFADLMKKQYKTTLERQALAKYMMRKNEMIHFQNHYMGYPGNYDHYSTHSNIYPHGYYENSSSMHSAFEHSNNSQISTKTTPMNKGKPVQNHSREFPVDGRDSRGAVDQREQRLDVQSKVNQIKISSNVNLSAKTQEQPKKYPNNQPLYRPKPMHIQTFHPQPTYQHQKIPSRILPPDILSNHQPFLQQPPPKRQPQHLPVQPSLDPNTLPKQQLRPQNKGEVFMLYHIPVIITKEDLKDIQADIILVPYSQLMVQEKQPSKWIEYIMSKTGVDVMKKLADMCAKEISERGREIPEGTLSRVRLSQRTNFSMVYLIKLSHFVDAESKKPHGQTILREGIYKALESFISCAQSGSGREKRLLIHGGYFPGVIREKTPKMMANFISLALANLSKDYKNMTKGIKIIINVPKADEHQEYLKHFRAVMIEYRKLEAL